MKYTEEERQEAAELMETDKYFIVKDFLKAITDPNCERVSVREVPVGMGNDIDNTVKEAINKVSIIFFIRVILFSYK